jgi:predicted metalloprotease
VNRPALDRLPTRSPLARTGDGGQASVYVDGVVIDATHRIAALLAGALIAAGCGSSTSSSSSSSAPATASSTTTSTVSADAISGAGLRSLQKVPAATGAAPSPAAGATTVDRSFLQAVFNDTQRLWQDEFTAAGLRYSPARLVIFSSSVHSACGFQENVGPFYCPADRTIYLDAGFFDLLARQAGLGGFAQAYVVGHEFGHHVQHLLGIDRRVAAANRADPGRANARSVRVELQADCLAGVWAHSAYTRAQLTTGDLEEKLRTAALIGDDFQARSAGRLVDPGLFTHGSSAQRQQWLRTGFESGDPGACDTFSSG